MGTSEPVLGIDFGESKICVAVHDSKGIRVLESAVGEKGTLSSLFYSEKENWIVGAEARDYSELSPARYVSNLKQLLKFHSIEDVNAFNAKSDTPVKFSKWPLMKLGDEGNTTRQHPITLAARIFKEIREHVCGVLDKNVTRCAVTYHFQWTPYEREVLTVCLKAAGFTDCVTLVSDFNAALLGCYLRTIKPESAERRIVVDIGLAETRITLFKLGNDQEEVLPTTLIPEGGLTIDKLLLDECVRDFKKRHQLDIRSDPEAKRRVLIACEKIKIELSTKAATVSVRRVMRDLDLEVTFTMPQFRKHICGPVAAKIVEAIWTRSAEFSQQNYELLLVGGGSRVLAIQELLYAFHTTKMPSSVHSFAEIAAAEGAAAWAAFVARSGKPITVAGVKTFLSRKPEPDIVKGPVADVDQMLPKKMKTSVWSESSHITAEQQASNKTDILAPSAGKSNAPKGTPNGDEKKAKQAIEKRIAEFRANGKNTDAINVLCKEGGRYDDAYNLAVQCNDAALWVHFGNLCLEAAMVSCAANAYLCATKCNRDDCNKIIFLATKTHQWDGLTDYFTMVYQQHRDRHPILLDRLVFVLARESRWDELRLIVSDVTAPPPVEQVVDDETHGNQQKETSGNNTQIAAVENEKLREATKRATQLVGELVMRTKGFRNNLEYNQWEIEEEIRRQQREMSVSKWVLLLGLKKSGKSTFLWLLDKGPKPTDIVGNGTAELKRGEHFVSFGLREWSPVEVLKLVVVFCFRGFPRDLVIFENEKTGHLPVELLANLSIQTPMVTILMDDFWTKFNRNEIRLNAENGRVRTVEPSNDLNLVYNTSVYGNLERNARPITHHDYEKTLQSKSPNPFERLINLLSSPSRSTTSETDKLICQAVDNLTYVFVTRYGKDESKFLEFGRLEDIFIR